MPATIVKIVDDLEIYKKVIQVLDEDGIVGLPTDTFYEIAVNGESDRAFVQLQNLKGKKLMTFFIARNLLADYVIITKKKIIDYFLPGPIIMIMKKKPGSKLLVSEDKIGIRIPDHYFVINLLNYYKKPIAVINGCIPGGERISEPVEIAEKFPAVSLIIDDGHRYGKDPTILDLTSPVPVVKQKGAIPILEIEKIFGRRIKLDPALKFSLLFVCSGNSCRSPMAVGIIKTMIDERYVEIKSAGTAAVDGLPASENALLIVKEFGGDISSHRTKYLTRELVDEADLILVMEYKHYETVVELSPAAAIKTFLLKEYKRKRRSDNEVSDPVGRDLYTYRDTALEMYPSLKLVADDIKKRLMV
ncbi:MAG: Sua5/YciO/YrdC/YwlC family protein [candidate division WOR-3 bacterium]|nr:Sua5/YciO/YrdC/YwlC family protein [candidate division WOR-3 bacterium]